MHFMLNTVPLQVVLNIYSDIHDIPWFKLPSDALPSLGH
jgi:hypothetical protein